MEAGYRVENTLAQEERGIRHVHFWFECKLRYRFFEVAQQHTPLTTPLQGFVFLLYFYAFRSSKESKINQSKIFKAACHIIHNRN